MIWLAVLGAAFGCYLLKLGGLLVPARVLRQPTVQRVAEQLPVALLMALVAVGTLADGRSLVLDARVAGLAAAVVALFLRAPFLVVVVVAAGTTALVRLI
ncbi:MAG TPA: AzlD domain-containing protein [Frankiaceae bacterium]|nr:AzlD domain-containing protein [Frankiaceae bacterium]